MRLRRTLRFSIPELAMLAGGYCAYVWIRDREGTTALPAALRHGEWVIDAEGALGLAQEHRLQAWMSRWPDGIKFLDSFWSYGYLISTVAVLAGLAVWRRDAYREARRAFVLVTVAALVVFAVFPTVPPRLLPPHYGVVDTWISVGGVAAQSPPHIESIADPFASMPSLHVAWSVWCAAAICSQLRGRQGPGWWAARVALWSYPVLTAFCVVVTGNHYIFDCLAGAALVACAARFLRVVSRRQLVREARAAAVSTVEAVPSHRSGTEPAV